MKTTGITRRIDELGRIVIPKEIRKNMHLKTGELLEIFLNDSETIILKKHSIIDKKEEFLKYYVDVLSSKLSADVFITNLNEIIFSNDDSLVGEKISAKLDDLISCGANFDGVNKLDLTNSKTLDNAIIKPLRPNGDLSSLLIVNFKNEKNNISSEIINFSSNFIEEYLENN